MIVDAIALRDVPDAVLYADPPICAGYSLDYGQPDGGVWTVRRPWFTRGHVAYRYVGADGRWRTSLDATDAEVRAERERRMAGA